MRVLAVLVWFYAVFAFLRIQNCKNRIKLLESNLLESLKLLELELLELLEPLKMLESELLELLQLRSKKAGIANAYNL